MNHFQDIYLVLEDGTVITGKSFGFFGDTDGEVVFNTGMTGYPESLTDPSYRGQILVSTYPLIGNYGVPDSKVCANNLEKFVESSEIQPRAFIISEYCEEPFHWNQKMTLSEWLKKEKIPGICNIDTRALTQKLREHGVMLGKITTKKPVDKLEKFTDPNLTNLVGEVSTPEVKIYKPQGKSKKRVLVYDFGIKNNIIRNFLERDITVIRVPWNYDLSQCEQQYDGLFLSPGPGDPKMIMKVSTANIKYAFKNKVPTFGICLGHQLIALAIGADTYKLKYGHRSVNQPCLNLENNQCYITSQNHGFAVDSKTLPQGWKLWMTNANDDTCEGLKHTSGRFFSVQFHPEANPGPKDTEFLFDEFIEIL